MSGGAESLTCTCICRRIDCAIIQDMISITNALQTKIVKDNRLMQNLDPKFVLVGSTQEGSRIGIGNEMDLSMHFVGWGTPFMVCNDAFHLHKSEGCPDWMSNYFDTQGRFKLDLFMNTVCRAVEEGLDTIFASGENPKNLFRVLTNDEYFSQKQCSLCDENQNVRSALYTQCVDCLVCVSRTKMGICLQFEWRDDGVSKPVYTSIDIVPVFNIKPIDTKSVIGLMNSTLIGPSHPPGWFNSLRNFVRGDQLVEELWSKGEVVDKILLKSLGKDEYFIRGGQWLKTETFCDNEILVMAYSYLKILRALWAIDNLSNFMIKKMLMDSRFVDMAKSVRTSSITYRPNETISLRRTLSDDAFEMLMKILSHSKFRGYFGQYIIYPDTSSLMDKKKNNQDALSVKH